MPSPPSSLPRRPLCCDACGRAELFAQAELLRFTRTGWPTCCGQVMRLADPLSADDPDATADDLRPLRAGTG